MNFLYIIADTKNNTYNGYTVNLERRIRQHNKEIKGGAKYTTRRVDEYNQWKYLITITCPDERFTKNKALSMEWSIKYPTNHRPRPKPYNTPIGRIESLPLVFRNPKFSDLQFQLHIHDETDAECVKHLFQDVENVVISSPQNIVTLPATDLDVAEHVS